MESFITCPECDGTGIDDSYCEYPHGSDYEPPFETCKCLECYYCDGFGEVLGEEGKPDED